MGKKSSAKKTTYREGDVITFRSRGRRLLCGCVKYRYHDYDDDNRGYTVWVLLAGEIDVPDGSVVECLWPPARAGKAQ